MSKNNKLCRVGTLEAVDMETGESVQVEGSGMMLMPAAPGTCEWCATAHEPHLPHNQQSLYYQMKFQAIKGRPPTWTDAMAHCEQAMRDDWKRELIALMTRNGMKIPEDLAC
jgi:hypothetical protein